MGSLLDASCLSLLVLLTPTTDANTVAHAIAKSSVERKTTHGSCKRNFAANFALLFTFSVTTTVIAARPEELRGRLGAAERRKMVAHGVSRGIGLSVPSGSPGSGRQNSRCHNALFSPSHSGFGKALKRSMLRDIASAMTTVLCRASLDSLRMATLDTNLIMLTWFFPEDARAAFEALDCEVIGRQLSQSLPRHWRALLELISSAAACDSNIATRIMSECDVNQLENQVRRYGIANRYELRLLLHLFCHATDEVKRSVAANLNDIVRQVCEANDSEAVSIITAYCRLDMERGSALAGELGLHPEDLKDLTDRDYIEKARQEYRELDANGDDYELKLDDEQQPQDGLAKRQNDISV